MPSLSENATAGFDPTIPPIVYFLFHQILSTFQSQNNYINRNFLCKHEFSTQNHFNFMKLAPASSVSFGTKEKVPAETLIDCTVMWLDPTELGRTP